METIYQCCAGLDVHQKTVVVCVRRLDANGRLQKSVRTYGTFTTNLRALADWLAEEGVTHVAMESTGVLWKPVYNLLEGRFEVLLVNAQHLKQVPGRKTDVKDCEWIVQLLQHGLLRGSFVPAPAQRELRDLTRHRAKLVEEKTAVVNRVHKTLEDANIKLGAVASDILGVSGHVGGVGGRRRESPNHGRVGSPPHAWQDSAVETRFGGPPDGASSFSAQDVAGARRTGGGRSSSTARAASCVGGSSTSRRIRSRAGTPSGSASRFRS